MWHYYGTCIKYEIICLLLVLFDAKPNLFSVCYFVRVIRIKVYMLLGQILKRVWFYISNSCLVLYTIKVDNHNYKIINHILDSNL